jgi:four helix bundle protein
VEEVFVLLGFKVSEFQGFKDMRSAALVSNQPHLEGLNFSGEAVARSYRELLVWQKAKALAVQTYRVTEQFPKNETYGLTSQTRRAAVSVASNIAEGQGRLTPGEFLHFLGQARGSLLELDTQVAIALDLTYLKPDQYEILDREIYQVLGLLNRLIESLRKGRSQPGSKP